MGKYPEWLKLKIVDAYSLGLSYANIAQEFGVSIGYVANTVRKAGIARSKAGTKGLYLRHDFFDCIDTEEKAYMLGLLLADGCVRDRNESEGGNIQHCICLELHRDDSYLLDRFLKLVNCKNKLTKHRNCFVLRFHSDHMAKTLSNFGIVPRKTGHERINWINNIPEHLQRHVLRGLIDGDGWVGTTIKQGKCIPNIGLTSSLECVKEVSEILSDKLNITKVSPVKHIGCYVITYDGKDSCVKIAEYLYKDSSIYMTRKYSKALEIVRLWS